MHKPCTILSAAETSALIQQQDAIVRARSEAAQQIVRSRRRSRQHATARQQQHESLLLADASAHMAQVVHAGQQLLNSFSDSLAQQFTDVTGLLLRTQAAEAWVAQCVRDALAQIGETEFVQVRVHTSLMDAALRVAEQVQLHQRVKLAVRPDDAIAPGTCEFISSAGRICIELEALQRAVNTSVAANLRQLANPAVRDAVPVAHSKRPDLEEASAP